MNCEWKKINTVSIIIFHIISILSIPYILVNADHLARTILCIVIVGVIAGFGVTAGAHRLWCHRSYKATLGFRIFLALCYSVAGQNSIYNWVRDHRVHHKYSDTEADPHNATRGFWFSHVGWLMMTKHPKVIESGRKISMKDVLDDPVVRWHTNYFSELKVLMCFVLPTALHMYVCNESWQVAVLSQMFVRYALSLNFTWLVNSAAHMWGSKPYDKNMLPSENKLVALLSVGEGWHNYHHVFPYDYKAAELGDYTLNFTTFVLDAAQRLGLVYDVKQPSKETIRRVALARGDGSWESDHRLSDDAERQLGEFGY